jgi:hypothetical protein
MNKIVTMVNGKPVKCGCYTDPKGYLKMCAPHHAEWQEVHDRWTADHNRTPEEWDAILAKTREDIKNNKTATI